MGQWIGKKGQKCPMCEEGVIKSGFTVTCGKKECIDGYRGKTTLKANQGEEKHTQTDSTWEISLPKTRIHTFEELVEFCKIDLNLWEVIECVFNKWEVGATPRATRADGKDNWVRRSTKMQVEPLFQVKVRLRKKKNIEAALREIEALKELAKESFNGEPRAVARLGSDFGKMLEINIPDLHVGKLAWDKETGWGNYDGKIAETVYWGAFETLLSRASGHDYEEVLFVVGNDLLNSDDTENQTTKGTTVTTDGRYHKSFGIVRTIMVKSIERLREKFGCRIKVLMISGNHDQLSVWHLGDSLQCYFHGQTDVTIDNMPRARKYQRFGNVMLMFTHGDKGKRDDYPLLMATEQPEMFGQTKFREAHTGHNHKTKLDEQHGVRVRVLPSLCAEDDWHAENGFVGNIRSAEGYIWDSEEGLISTVFASRAPVPTVAR